MAEEKEILAEETGCYAAVVCSSAGVRSTTTEDSGEYTPPEDTDTGIGEEGTEENGEYIPPEDTSTGADSTTTTEDSGEYIPPEDTSNEAATTTTTDVVIKTPTTTPQATAKEETTESQNKTPESVVADPVDVATGAHTIKNNIMRLFGGQQTAVWAQYNSTRLVAGELGVGWHHNYEKHIELAEYEALVYESPSVYSVYYAADEMCTVFECYSPGKQGYILSVDANEEYPYCLNCNYEKTEYYDEYFRLAKIVDRHGGQCY